MTTLRAPKRSIPFALAVGVLLASAGPAFAHVEITSPAAVAGQPATMTLTVPNEREDAATVQVALRYPEGRPLTAVMPAATPGWTATVDDAGIVWNGGPLGGDDEVALTFTATLPSGVDRLEFPVLQTYDDGEVVRWIQLAPEGSPEPDFPAPVLAVSPAASAPGAQPTTAPTTVAADDHAEADDEAERAADNDQDEDDDAAPVIIAIVAVVAALAVGGGTLIYFRRRRATP